MKNDSDEVIKIFLILICVINIFVPLKIFKLYKEKILIFVLTKSDLASYRMKKLFGIVIGRKEINKKLNYDERFGKEFHPYKLIRQILEIEEALWNHGYGRIQSMCFSVFNDTFRLFEK